ncbi:FkbM family methyltransferase [Imhoffiella purpurea]|uniref:Methyltransferase FkbM domain-containing protein n=1 Tax=Imhoffiella purpurea TaxID=1249627 RepID=W9VBW6_9GAMM|nr:FkbM family methyltransferase [Imhoffiella purpurea]EXJ16914.1 hypothetical protein D779_2525 [Imhoffiella purpurea]
MSDTERLLEQALEHHRAGRGEAAGWLYRAVLAMDAEQPESNFNLGVLELESGHIDSGLVHLKKAVENAPDVLDYWVKLAEALLLSQRSAEARDVIERAENNGLRSPLMDDLLLRIGGSVGSQNSSRATVEKTSTSGPHDLLLSEALTSSLSGQREDQIEPFIVNIQGDVKVCVPADIHCVTTYVLLEQEDWYEPELGWLRRYIQPGMSVLDVGAGYGVYALTMGKIIQGKGHVLALEPDRISSGLLARSIVENGLDGHVSVICEVISDKSGEVEMPVCSALRSTDLGGDQSTQLVKSLTLDELAKEVSWPHDSDLSFIRINAKGFEAKIMQGGLIFFSKHSPLVMFGVEGNKISENLIGMFTELRMHIYRLIPGLNALVLSDSTGSADVSKCNLFACGEERAEMLRMRGLMI